LHFVPFANETDMCGTWMIPFGLTTGRRSEMNQEHQTKSLNGFQHYLPFNLPRGRWSLSQQAWSFTWISCDCACAKCQKTENRSQYV
jgi:hypothetical protein